MLKDELGPVRAALARTGPDTSDFDLSAGVKRAAPGTLRDAAVLVALWPKPDGLHVILSKRSSHMRNHPGQIAFPGGKVDAGDADAVAAALREAEEEIGLPRDLVDILGLMPPHETVTGFSVTPVLGRIRDDFDVRPEPGEVEEVFTVPLAHLADPAHYRVEGRRWLGRRRNYYVVPYGPYYIWGATARILKALAERMAA